MGRRGSDAVLRRLARGLASLAACALLSLGATSGHAGDEDAPVPGTGTRVRGRMLLMPGRRPIAHGVTALFESDAHVPVHADADGRFEVAVPSPGAFLLSRARVAESEKEMIPLRRVVDPCEVPLELLYSEAPMVSLQVREAGTGKRLPHATFWEDSESSREDLLARIPAGPTVAAGEGRLDVPLQGEVGMGFVTAEGHAPTYVVLVPETPPGSVVMLHPAGSLHVLPRPDAAPAEETDVTVRHVETSRSHRFALEPASRPVLLTALPSGDYEIRVDRRGPAGSCTLRVRVAEGGSTDVSIPLSTAANPVGTARGEVEMPAGWGLDVARLRVERGHEMVSPAVDVALTNGRGAFDISRIPMSEDLHLVVLGTGVRVPLRLDGDTVEVRVRVPEPVTLSVRVTSADGTAAANALVEWTWLPESPTEGPFLHSSQAVDKAGIATIRAPAGFVALQASREPDSFSALTVRHLRSGEKPQVDLALGASPSLTLRASVGGRVFPLGPAEFRLEGGGSRSVGTIGSILRSLSIADRPGIYILDLVPPTGFPAVHRRVELLPGQVQELRLEYTAK
jgi:hypothetical protein